MKFRDIKLFGEIWEIVSNLNPPSKSYNRSADLDSDFQRLRTLTLMTKNYVAKQILCNLISGIIFMIMIIYDY